MFLGCKDKSLDQLVQKDSVFWNVLKKEIVKEEYGTSIKELPKEKLDSLLNKDASRLFLKRLNDTKNNDTLYFLCYQKAPNLLGNIYFEDALKIYEISEDSSSFKIEIDRIQHGDLGELLGRKNH